MNGTSILDLIYNTALLLALVLLLDLGIGKRHISNTPVWQVLIGAAIGGVGIILMMTPWVLTPGVIFDTRSVLLGISGLFFGSIPTLIAMVITAAYRIYLGGSAAVMGVSVIFTTGIIGVLWRKRLRKPLSAMTPLELYLFGVTIHVDMLLCAFVLPVDRALTILSNISLPVMLIYPVGTMLLGLIMTNRLRREKSEIELIRSAERMRSMVDILQHPVESAQEFLDYALGRAIQLTESRLGFIYQYSETSQQFQLKAYTHMGLTENSPPSPSHEFLLSKAQFLGEAVRQRKAIIINDHRASNKMNYPKGHVPIQKSLCVPLFHDQNIVAVVCVANKDTPYDEFDSLQLTLLMDGVWKAGERKAAEEALRQSEERYKAIVDNLPNGLIQIFDRDLRIVFIAGEQKTKNYLASEDVLGKSIYEMYGSEMGGTIAARYRSVLNGEPVHFEWHVNSRYFLVHAAPLYDEQGEVSQILALSFDISERKQAEERLQAAQEELKRLLEESDLSRKTLLSVVEDQKRAEENLYLLNLELEERVRDRTIQLEVANKELEAFAYSVSHDLRAPLRALDGFSSALIADFRDRLDETGLHYLNRIQEASKRMGQLIEDLLKLSRISRKELSRIQVNLSQTAAQIASELTRQDPARNVEFNISPQIEVFADPNLLRIVLENLLGNAYKFTSHKEHALIEFGKRIENGQEQYYIRDNGAGFDMTYADKLFIPFQRLHREQDFPGTGIGLVTVQRIIAKHGGRIWPDASPGQGATFYFTLGDK